MLRPKLDDSHITQLIRKLLVSQIKYAMPVYLRIRLMERDPLTADMVSI